LKHRRGLVGCALHDEGAQGRDDGVELVDGELVPESGGHELVVGGVERMPEGFLADDDAGGPGGRGGESDVVLRGVVELGSAHYFSPFDQAAATWSADSVTSRSRSGTQSVYCRPGHWTMA